MLLRLSLTIALLATSCTHAQVASQQIDAPRATPTATPSHAQTPSSAQTSPIHKIDFENFTYPARPIFPKGEKTFTLKDGLYAGRLQSGAVEPEPVSLVDTIYADVTGDGVDDAIVVLTESIRGSAIPYYIYVYAIERDKPKLLWSFDTGDRAQSGLRRAFAENGNLVVELYGKNAYVGMLNYDDSADCAACATHYTGSRYAWQGNHFRRIGNLEVFDHEGSAKYLENP
jgi:hypothetical protein